MDSNFYFMILLEFNTNSHRWYTLKEYFQSTAKEIRIFYDRNNLFILQNELIRINGS